MYVNKEAYDQLCTEAAARQATLVAVSKTKPVEAILELYNLGHRDFGENYVQELVDKAAQLPPDIRWHFIGHLQSNKVKYIAPLVHLIHGIDSLKLLKEVNKQGQKNNRVLPVLLQVHIAREETKFGLSEVELRELLSSADVAGMNHVRIAGLMGMASFTGDKEIVRSEFRQLKALYDQYAAQTVPNTSFNTLSMGMSGDYPLALAEGSNLLRIGSLLFGSRQ